MRHYLSIFWILLCLFSGVVDCAMSEDFDYLCEEEDYGETEPPLYRLHTGDKLLISIYGEYDSQRVTFVDSTGHISYLFLDKVPALGKTIEEVREYIKNELKTYYRYPVVIISPLGFTNNSYTILGEVNQPGVKSIQGNATILTAIAYAGGFTTKIFKETTIDQSDLRQSFLARNGEYVPVDFEKLIEEGDTSQDVLLEDGDFIYIKTAAQREVYVLGEVNIPLTIEFYGQLSLMEAMAYAGGTTVRASSRIAVIRGSLCHPTRYLIDFNRIKKAKACDFPLEPGDIIFVPPQHFLSLKELFRTGMIAFVSNLSSIAGTNAYISIQPAAFGNVNSPVPVINTNAGPVTSVVGTPVGP